MPEKFHVLPAPGAAPTGEYAHLSDALEAMGGGLVVAHTGRLVAAHSNWDEAALASGAIGRAHKVKPSRNRYRFTGREEGINGPLLRWERPVPGDSRVDELICSADWFYGQMLPSPPPEPASEGDKSSDERNATAAR